MNRTRQNQALANSLAHRYQDGETAALGKLYYLIIPYMVRAAQCSGARDEAWDIAHDAFLRVGARITNMSNPTPIDNVLAYATMATRRLALNLLRRRHHRSTMVNIDSILSSSAIVSDAQSPEAIVDALMREKWRSIVLADALSKLRYDHRRILESFYDREMGCDQIGKIIGVPTGTVLSRLQAARKKLGRVLNSTLKPEQRQELFPDR